MKEQIPDKLKEEIRKRLKDLRLKFNFTQQSLADEIGMSFSAMHKIEKGHTFPRDSTRYKLAKLFKTDETLLPLPSKKPFTYVQEEHSDYLSPLEKKAVELAREIPIVINNLHNKLIKGIDKKPS